MAVRPILRMGNPGLRRPASPVPVEAISCREVQILIDDLVDTMRAARGAGIAAPQIGCDKRICIVEVDRNPRYPELEPIGLSVWINPELEVRHDAASVSMLEGCLSVPGIRGRVERPGAVLLRAWDRDGQPVEATFSGLSACVVQHEVDHLNGILFVDRADTRTLAFHDRPGGEQDKAFHA